MENGEQETNPESPHEIFSLCVKIMHTLILKGASKPVLDKTFFDLKEKSLTYILGQTEATKNYLLPYLRSRYKNLQEADEEQVSQMDIFLPDYKKPEQSHLLFEEGGLRNVDDYTIGRAAQ